MINALLVGTGGFFGAILRYLLSDQIHSRFPDSTFPFWTLSVNIVGCLLIGVLSQLVGRWSGVTRELQLLFVVGFVGSFSTYSTFGNETLALLEGAELLKAGLYVCGHILMGVGAVMLGRWGAGLCSVQ